MLDASITAAILCGGQGTRLRPVLGESLPKCLAPVGGRPFLDYVLTHLISQKVKKAVLCLGYRAEKVIDKYPDKYFTSLGEYDDGIELEFSVEEKPLGTGGALRKALTLLDSDPVLVMNGDTFCKFDLAFLMREPEVRNAKVWYSKDFVNTGVRLLSKHFIQSLPLVSDVDNVIGNLREMNAAHGDMDFVDIGTPEGYDRAQGFLRQEGMLK